MTEDAFLELAWRASNHVERCIPREEWNGVSATGVRALSAIAHEGQPSVAELSALLQRSQPTVSEVCALLRKRGLIRRAPGPDRRESRHVVTPDGRRLLLSLHRDRLNAAA